MLKEIFVTSPDRIVQSVMSTMGEDEEDAEEDAEEDFVLTWKDSPGMRFELSFLSVHIEKFIIIIITHRYGCIS